MGAGGARGVVSPFRKADEGHCRFGLRGKWMETEAMEKILEKIDNRYEAIRVIAKEARRINTLIRLSGEEFEEKPTTIAVKRTIDGKVKYTYEQQEEQE